MSEALLLVTGSRRWPWAESQWIDNALWDAFCGLVVSGPFDTMRVLHGKAGGVDSIADKWALDRYYEHVRVKRMGADWFGPCRATCVKGHRRVPRTGTNTYCPAAGNYRNQEMVDLHPHAAVAFRFTGRTTGTNDCIRRLTAAKVPTLIYDFGNPEPVWADSNLTAWAA
jgi:hypothetical protein